MNRVRVTHIGGPTLLLEVGPWRLLTDPTFDPPGRRYAFALGTSSRKLAAPAVAADTIGRIDAVLLSHDQHADNLDDAGRRLLPGAGTIVTTTAAAARLSNLGTVRGLVPWQSTRLAREGVPSIDVTATPCRHGPPVGHRLAGSVIGFSLRWVGQRHGDVWISGDTVLYDGVRQVASRLRIGTAFLHLGAVRFPISGPFRYTMTAADAVELAASMPLHSAIPIHYDGWSHFSEGRTDAERAIAAHPRGDRLRSILTWIEPGTPRDLDV